MVHNSLPQTLAHVQGSMLITLARFLYMHTERGPQLSQAASHINLAEHLLSNQRVPSKTHRTASWMTQATSSVAWAPLGHDRNACVFTLGSPVAHDSLPKTLAHGAAVTTSLQLADKNVIYHPNKLVERSPHRRCPASRGA